MKEQFERFSIEIASGVSRRGAFATFLAGLGATLIGRPAKAQAPARAVCMAYCRMQAQLFLDVCLKASSTCPVGFCAEVAIPPINSIQINPTSGSAKNVNTIN